MRKFIIFFIVLFIFSCSKDKTVDPEPEKEYFDFYTSLTPDTSGIYCEIHLVYPNQDSIVIYNIYGGDSYHGEFEQNKNLKIIAMRKGFTHTEYINTEGLDSLTLKLKYFHLNLHKLVDYFFLRVYMCQDIDTIGIISFWGGWPPDTINMAWYMAHNETHFYTQRYDSNGIHFYTGWYDTVNTTEITYYNYVIDSSEVK
ncbi:hypothetical protein KAU34_00305 [candidate division WOR-3 bacterium]|nr:hypothetical protein [candidate division WOR-3 bacterium]